MSLSVDNITKLKLQAWRIPGGADLTTSFLMIHLFLCQKGLCKLLEGKNHQHSFPSVKPSGSNNHWPSN